MGHDSYPNVIYLQADAADPRAVLDAPETRALLGDERRVGIIFHSLAHLMADAPVRASWQMLYDWAAPGSYLSVSGLSEQWTIDPDLRDIAKVYFRANVTGYFRSAAQYRDLLPVWRLTEEGIVDNFYWGLAQPPRLPHLYSYSMMFYK